MKPESDSALFLSSLCPFAKADRAVCTVELCGYATASRSPPASSSSVPGPDWSRN